MIWYDVMWYDMIWYDMIWCDMIVISIFEYRISNGTIITTTIITNITSHSFNRTEERVRYLLDRLWMGWIGEFYKEIEIGNEDIKRRWWSLSWLIESNRVETERYRSKV